MKNTIGVIADPGVGGTFLNWTLHYLAGHSQIYSVKQDKWVDLVDDPTTSINAHNFKPNQPISLIQFDLTFDKLVHTNSELFHSIYFHHFGINSNDTSNAVRQLQANINKGIILSLSNDHCLYQRSYTSRAGVAPKWSDRSIILTDPDEIFNDYVDSFFKDSKEKWIEAGLTNIWDKREFIALNVDYKKIISINQVIDDKNNFYVLNCMDLFNTFDTTVYKLFEYLNLKINPDKFEKWGTVYAKWKKLHYNRIRFVWYFDNIIDNIISGKAMDLEQFDLDIVQEAALQRTLIYKYSLNVKTWQLEKFTNTKQLHDLLESNLHNLNTN